MVGQTTVIYAYVGRSSMPGDIPLRSIHHPDIPGMQFHRCAASASRLRMVEDISRRKNVTGRRETALPARTNEDARQRQSRPRGFAGLDERSRHLYIVPLSINPIAL